MRYYKVDKPCDCPWRMVLSCTYRNGGYSRMNITCGPYTKDFPENCPLPDSTADIKEPVQQPLTQAKVAETLPEGEICADNIDADELARKYGKCKCGGEVTVSEWQCDECGRFIGNP